MITRTRGFNAFVAIACTGVLAAGGLVGAAPAQAGETYAECMSSTQGIETWGCYDVQVAPSSAQTAAVKLTWTLNTSAEGFSNSDWKGGFILHRWPVKGQWKKYPPLRRVDLPGAADKCTGATISATTCYGLFNGAAGEQIIEFGPKMAGFVYEVVSNDYICSTDQASCGPSGGSADRYVFVLRASRYTNKKGETVTSLKCPPAKSRSSSCSPVLTAKVVNNIGGGEPVPIS
jgi:hypothetical protein